MGFVTALAMAALATAAPAHNSSLTVTTINGTLQGGICTDTGARYFLSIPFAQPPVDNLRFVAPQPYNKTFTHRNATISAPSCIQFDLDLAAGSLQSEDCLYLDIWTPTNVSATKALPVKIWLYGGYNEAGSISDPLYSGCYSATDAVIVSLNYRVGPLGWFALQDADLMGNYGLQDQILGLRWVQENIKKFGGNPNEVLLFGQSAGAIDAFAISTLPDASRLVKAVALESGDGSYLATLSEAAEWNQQFASGLNCTSSFSAGAIQSCLRSSSVSQISTAVSRLAVLANPMSIPQVGTPYNNFGRGNAWGPLVDGTLLTQPPAQAGSRVPLIIGSNSQDGTLYVLNSYGADALALTSANYSEFLVSNFGPYASVVNQTYPLSLFNSTLYPVYEAVSTVFTHARLRCFSQQGANVSTAMHGVAAYTYSFNHSPSCDWEDQVPNSAALLQLLGATHTAEIPFVFGHTQNLPPPSGTCNFTNAEVGMSGWMKKAWTNMASYGKPGMGWTAFEAAGNGTGMNYGDAAVVGKVDYSMCEFWNPLFEAILGY